MTMISANLQSVHARIAAACAAAGRDVNLVTLLAVSKTFGADAVQEAVAAGQTAFGENYIQEAVEKMAQVRRWESELPLASGSRRTEWHCIGPIQSNKTRLVAENFDWVHTVDRLKIAQRLSEQRPAHLAPLQVCIQVNIDGGPTKSGVAPGEALALAQAMASLPRLVLRGIMCIPDVTTDTIANYSILTSAKDLFDRIGQENRPPAAAGTPPAPGAVPAAVPTEASFSRFDTLSLGMTADLEAAVRAGSTMVRVGTAIFGGRSPAAAQLA
jgi:PLP dependent protein